MIQDLRDSRGKKIGEIEENYGKKVLRDAQGRLVGTGDLLTTLLK